MLGIDVSKDSLSCTLLDPITKRKQWYREVENSATGWKQLLKLVPEDSSWVLEPTGRYSQDVARAARQKGRDVRMAEPKRAQHYLKSLQDRAKTDKLDSYGLALYGLSAQLRPFPLKDEMHEELDQLLAARKGISQSIAELQARKRDLPRAAEVLAPAIEALEAQRKLLDAKIKVCSRDPQFALIQELLKVPGFGPVVSATLASRLTSRHFSNSDQFVADCGLDIRIRQSGKKSGQMGLSKRGDSELRRLLYLAAQANLAAKDSPFQELYRRERAKRLSSTAALCAVARKMARLAWAMAAHGTSYDPDRVTKAPVPASTTSEANH